MKIVIVGPGALGCLLAATLAAAGEDEILLLDHNHSRAALLCEQGIILEKNGQPQTYHLPVTASPAEVSPADIIILATKSLAVSAVLSQIRPIKTEDLLLVALQNGIMHLDYLSEQLPVGQWAAGVTALGAALLAPGRVRHGGQGVSKLGFYPRRANLKTSAAYSRQEKKLANLAGVMNRAGLQTEVSRTIIDHVWAKLLINVGINALTAIHNCANGDLLRPELRDISAKAVMEAAAVARALHIDIPSDIVALTLSVIRSTAQNISSMLQDVRRKRPTEIDAINGAVIRAAAGLGIETPVNNRLLQQIKIIEKNYGS